MPDHEQIADAVSLTHTQRWPQASRLLLQLAGHEGRIPFSGADVASWLHSDVSTAYKAVRLLRRYGILHLEEESRGEIPRVWSIREPSQWGSGVPWVCERREALREVLALKQARKQHNKQKSARDRRAGYGLLARAVGAQAPSPEKAPEHEIVSTYPARKTRGARVPGARANRPSAPPPSTTGGENPNTGDDQASSLEEEVDPRLLELVEAAKETTGFEDIYGYPLGILADVVKASGVRFPEVLAWARSSEAPPKLTDLVVWLRARLRNNEVLADVLEHRPRQPSERERLESDIRRLEESSDPLDHEAAEELRTRLDETS